MRVCPGSSRAEWLLVIRGGKRSALSVSSVKPKSAAAAEKRLNLNKQTARVLLAQTRELTLTPLDMNPQGTPAQVTNTG